MNFPNRIVDALVSISDLACFQGARGLEHFGSLLVSLGEICKTLGVTQDKAKAREQMLTLCRERTLGMPEGLARQRYELALKHVLAHLDELRADELH